MTYPQIFSILLESRLLREKEGSSLLVYTPITLLFPHFYVFLHFLSYSYVPSFLPYFLFLFFLAIFLTCFSLLFLIAFSSSSFIFIFYYFYFFGIVFPLLCTTKAFLYCLLWWVLLFYPSTTFGLVWVLNYPLVCRLSSHHHYPMLAVPRSIPRKNIFVLFSYSRGFPIRVRVGYFLLLTPMACT